MQLASSKSAKFFSQTGQAAVEYILMLVAVSFIMMSVFGKLKGYMVDNPDSLLNNFTKAYQGPGFLDGNYKRFSLKR